MRCAVRDEAGQVYARFGVGQCGDQRHAAALRKAADDNFVGWDALFNQGIDVAVHNSHRRLDVIHGVCAARGDLGIPCMKTVTVEVGSNKEKDWSSKRVASVCGRGPAAAPGRHASPGSRQGPRYAAHSRGCHPSPSRRSC
jgi:hypothetical protein